MSFLLKFLIRSSEPVSGPIGKHGPVWQPDLMIGPPYATIFAVPRPDTDLCRLLSSAPMPALVSAIVDCTTSEEPLQELYGGSSRHLQSRLMSSADAE